MVHKSASYNATFKNAPFQHSFSRLLTTTSQIVDTRIRKDHNCRLIQIEKREIKNTFKTEMVKSSRLGTKCLQIEHPKNPYPCRDQISLTNELLNDPLNGSCKYLANNWGLF